MKKKIGIVPFWKGYNRKDVLRSARLAEELGYHSIWIPEAWGYEQFQLLTEVAGVTRSIRLATGIANIYSRSAALLAMSAATLDEISGGRAILGLGTSGKNVIENLHGIPYEKPLTRMRETVKIIRTLISGERLMPEMTTLFEVRPFRLEMKPFRPEVPIYIASLQEKAIREVGKIADGWLPTFWPYEHLSEAIGWITEGARAARRDPKKVDIAAFLPIVPYEDTALARTFVKPAVSFYIGGMGTYYYEMFCRYGFEETATRVRDLYKAGERSKAAAAVSDELIDAIAICGPPEYCREKLAEWYAKGLGTALMNLPVGAPPEMTEKLLRDMAPES